MGKTLSLCQVCFKYTPADVFFRDGQVWMRKNCSTHGDFENLVEPSANFYRMIKSMYYQPVFETSIFLDVTDRCNMQWTYCLYGIDNTHTDPPS